MKKIPYLMFTLVVLLLTTSIWWDLIRLKVRMIFSASILFSILFLMLFFSRYFLSKYFLMLLFTSLCCFIPGFEISYDNYLSWIHTAPSYLYLPFACTGILAYILVKHDYKLLIITLFVAFLFINYTAYKTMLADVNASRIFWGNARTIDAMLIVAENLKEAIMGYAHIHAIPFIIVGLICIFKRSDIVILKILGLLMTIVLFCALIKSGYTTATICTGLTVVLSSISTKNRKLCLILFAFLAVLVIILVKTGVLLNILEVVVKPLLDEKSNLVSKIDEFAAAQTTVDGSKYWNGRSFLYELSWNTFLEHPIFGAGVNSGGGHSYFIDLMADHGLFFFVPYLIYYIMIFRFIYQFLPRESKWYYLISCISLSLLLLFKANGLIAQNYIMCLVLPLMLIVRKKDFYEASNKIRRQLRLSPIENFVNC